MPATGNLQDDWGPANFDVRRRFNLAWSSSQLRNFNANINLNVSSAPPYTVRTGVDTNRDLVFNDRPDGVGRNTERGSVQWNMNGFFSYGWQFGKPVQMPGGVSLGADARRADGDAGRGDQRRALPGQHQRQIQNLTNHSNLGGYIGTITSRDFRHPTQVSRHAEDRYRGGT